VEAFVGAMPGAPAAEQWQTAGTGTTVDILDSGCGEGYYLEQLQDHLTAALPE
jgi:hypothetical protein